METDTLLQLFNMTDDVHSATKAVVDIITVRIWPLMLNIKKKLLSESNGLPAGDILKLKDVFTLSCSQIKKSVSQLFVVFKLEHVHSVIMQESRLCLLERLSWCVNKLDSVDKCLEDHKQKGSDSMYSDVEDTNNSILTTPMYFVTWIDHTFELLTKLSNIIYRTDYKSSVELYDTWKDELTDCINVLRLSVDELLLSAMTLNKYCLPSDQHIVSARCQVVLRETKVLLTELADEDENDDHKITKDSLKLPIMPSNINVLIDVLKNVLYALETNTNTALLALLVHCFSNSVSPVDKLRNYFKDGHHHETNEVEGGSYIKEFDMYNERLLQIGTFAVSCSSDENRILALRSGLASLEALDPHLVPALMLSPSSHHADVLVDSWRQEVNDIRDSVFLIVDPAAFAEKCKQLMNKTLLELLQIKRYDNAAVCDVINIGSIVYDFYTVYDKYEPDALTHRDKLMVLLKNLDKVQMECKIVSNMLSSDKNDFLYNMKEVTNKPKATVEQLHKRLKLLYTLINRINNLYLSKADDIFADFEDGDIADTNTTENVTHNVDKKPNKTYVKDGRKIDSNTFISRSIFARTPNTKPMKNSVLTRHLTLKRSEEINFSVQIDELFNNISNSEHNNIENVTNKQISCIKENSVLYNFSPMKSRSSLRKVVLNRNHCKSFELKKKSAVCDQTFDKTSILDVTAALQITEILDQFGDMSIAPSATKDSILNATDTINSNCNLSSSNTDNVLTLNINNGNTSVSKRLWNIPVNTDIVEVCLDNTTDVSGTTLPSNVNTLERVRDLNMLEDKLNDLKLLHRETTL